MTQALALIAWFLAPPASIDLAAANARLAAVRTRVALDLDHGRPLVAQAHVALCSNEVIRCGERGLGDGDDLRRNLYWATRGGMRGWMDRAGSGWRPVAVAPASAAALRRVHPNLLDVRVWERREPVADGRARRPRPARVLVVAYAWRGAAIDQALDAYLDDLGGAAHEDLTLADGRTLAVRAGAHVVAFIGHNRFMDRVDLGADEVARRIGADGVARGAIAVACESQAYLEGPLAASAHAPLLLTRSFVFAGTMPFEAALVAFARGAGLAEMRSRAARAYAEGENKRPAQVDAAFTNPAHARW